MNEPKITVIIPTRERCDVLEKSLRTVTAQSYDKLDILISDNFSTDNTERVVRSVNDRRVRYVNTGERLSMSHNWEFALSHVGDEGWVTIIGDDDGLLPGSLNRIADIIRSTDALAIRTSVCPYRWPNLMGTNFGRLGVPLRSGYEVRKSGEWLAKLLSGKVSYTQLPMLYNGGFVSMTVLRKIKSKNGVVYRSCNPDIYSAVAISSVIDKYVYSHEPSAINGASPHSTGTSHFAAKNRLDFSPADRFASEKNIPIHREIPLCADGRIPKSLQILAYESYLQSKSLRPVADANIHAEQLEVILATSGVHDSVISEWGAEFARKHKLDYDLIRMKARRRKVVLKVSSIADWASLVMNTYGVGSPQEPIEDVYEASIAAAVIRANTPGRTKRLLRLVKRAVQKSLKIGSVSKK